MLFEVSFDSGAHWLTLYETGVLDRLGGIVAIAEPGRDYEFRLTLTNDAQGRGAEVYKLLFCTDPSVWAKSGVATRACGGIWRLRGW